MRQFIRTDGLHRRLEGWPLVFTVLTTLAILVGSVVEIAPLFLVGSRTQALPEVRPFTPLELAGRDIYIREGCNNCHSQMVRPFRDELVRYGPYTRAGETAFERPFLWGSKRTGPDLGRVGGKYPHLWHVRHMVDPRSTSPRSLMPAYPWLLERSLRIEDVSRKVSVMRRLGVPYDESEVLSAVSDARRQAAEIAAAVRTQGGPEGLEDREIIALVAYLQRLGVDYVPPEAVSR